MLRLLCARSVWSWGLTAVLILTFAALEVNQTPAALLQEEAGAADPAKPESEGETPKIKFERLLIPIKDLGAALTSLPGAGFLTYEEFVDYLEKKQAKVAKPPVAAVINQASYDVELGEKLAQVKVELKVRALAEGWSWLSLPFQSSALGDWTCDNDDAFLYATAPGQYLLQMPDAGEYTLKLTMECPVVATPEGNQVDLHFPSVALTTLKAKLEKENSTLELMTSGKSSPLAKSVGAQENKTVELEANIGAVALAVLRWYPTNEEKMDDQLLVHAQKWLKLHVEDRQLQSDGYFEFEVLKGKLKQLELLIPKGERVLDLSSSSKIDDWNLEETEESQKLIIKLYEEVTGKVSLEVHTEREFALPEQGPAELVLDSDPETTSVTLMKSAQAAREVGQLILSTSNDLELTVQEEQGLSRIIPQEVDKRVAFNNGVASRFYAGRFQLRAEVRPITPKVNSHQTTVALLTADQVWLESVVTLNIERAGIFEVAIVAPEGAEQVEVSGPAVAQHRLQTDTNRLLIDLKQKTLGAIQINLSCVGPIVRDAEKTELPMFTVEGSERNTGVIDVLATTDLEVVTDVQQVVSARSRPSTELSFPRDFSPEFRKLLARSQRVSSWQYQQQPVTIPLSLKVRPARLSASLANQVQIREELIELSTTINYFVEYAQLDTFRFKVPQTYAEKVQIELVAPKDTAIKQKTSSEPDAENWVTWTVVLQRPVMGNVSLLAKAFLPLENGEANNGDANGNPPAAGEEGPPAVNGKLQLLLPRPLGLEESGDQTATPLTQIQGEVALEKIRSLSVTAQPVSGNLEAIDVRELTRLPKSGIAAYRYVETVDSDPISLELSVTKSEIQEVIKTVIPRAMVEIVTNQEPVAMLRFRAQVLTSERQRLVLGLPKNGVSLGVWIDGRQAALEKSEIPATNLHEYYYVSVARQKAADDPFSLALICRWPLNTAPYSAWGGSFDFPLPSLGQESDLNIAVQQLRVAIWTPRDHVLIGQPKGFMPTDQPPVLAGLTAPLLENDDSTTRFNDWIGNSTTGIVEFPVEGRVHDWIKLGASNDVRVSWWSVIPFTVVISGAIVLIAILLIKAPWPYRLTLLLLAAFGMSLLALSDPDRVYHLLQMGRYGLITMAGIWIVALVGWTGSDLSKTQTSETAKKRGEITPETPKTPSDETPPEPESPGDQNPPQQTS